MYADELVRNPDTIVIFEPGKQTDEVVDFHGYYTAIVHSLIDLYETGDHLLNFPEYRQSTHGIAVEHGSQGKRHIVQK